NIDLSKVKLDETLEEIQIDYRPTILSVVNNGHTIQASDQTGNNTMIVEGEAYTLLQVHFHTPSENTINGKHFDMEGHLVHENKEGELAVIGILFEVGEKNNSLANLFSKIPTEKTEQPIETDNPVNLLNILPTERKSFRYS